MDTVRDNDTLVYSAYFCSQCYLDLIKWAVWADFKHITLLLKCICRECMVVGMAAVVFNYRMV